MQKFTLGRPPPGVTTDQKIEWLMQCMVEIQTTAAQIDAFRISDAFTVSNPTAQRTLDVSAGTLTDVKRVLGTLIADLKSRGSKRT